MFCIHISKHPLSIYHKKKLFISSLCFCNGQRFKTKKNGSELRQVWQSLMTRRFLIQHCATTGNAILFHQDLIRLVQKFSFQRTLGLPCTACITVCYLLIIYGQKKSQPKKHKLQKLSQQKSYPAIYKINCKENSAFPPINSQVLNLIFLQIVHSPVQNLFFITFLGKRPHFRQKITEHTLNLLGLSEEGISVTLGYIHNITRAYLLDDVNWDKLCHLSSKGMCAYQMERSVFDQVINAHPDMQACKQLQQHDSHT